MHQLRRHKRLQYLVWLWFCLATGWAMAAPFFQASSLVVVCSAQGTRLVDTRAEDVNNGHVPQAHEMNCLACLVGVGTVATTGPQCTFSQSGRPAMPAHARQVSFSTQATADFLARAPPC